MDHVKKKRSNHCLENKFHYICTLFSLDRIFSLRYFSSLKGWFYPLTSWSLFHPHFIFTFPQEVWILNAYILKIVSSYKHFLHSIYISPSYTVRNSEQFCRCTIYQTFIWQIPVWYKMLQKIRKNCSTYLVTLVNFINI